MNINDFGTASAGDWRDIKNGLPIPREDYCDQPFIVQADDGAWLCVMTTAQGHEGTSSQHVVSTRSIDQGRTWEPLVDIEPSGPPEASYVTHLKVPSGRIYAFYNHNSDNLRRVIAREGDEYSATRMDSLGYFVFKFSDDGGKSWSQQRFNIPVREFEIDRQNPYGGKVRFFWHVGKPLVHRGAAYVSLHKVGAFGDGFMESSEGVFLRSKNLLTETDPAKINWETLPDGDIGLHAPLGPVADEHKLVEMNDGSLFCTYRTTDGHSCHAYSRDGGHSWTPPQYMTYAPGGRKIKHPRAATFAWKASNGRYLYWFHNHGGRDYPDRNPVWLCGGTETNGLISWSQPEIFLYDDDPVNRMSYPDLVEQDGRFWITETQKTEARLHAIPNLFLKALWNQAENRDVAQNGLSLEISGSTAGAMPLLPNLLEGGGFSLEFWLHFEDLRAGQLVFDSRGAGNIALSLQTTPNGTLQLVLNDGRTENSWECDQGVLQAGKRHHVVATVDGGPKIITFVLDGVLCDGGETRQFGWGRFSPHLRRVGGETFSSRATVESARVYRRAILTSEAVGNYRAGL